MSHRRKPLSVETFKAHSAEEVLKAALTELGWKNVNTSQIDDQVCNGTFTSIR